MQKLLLLFILALFSAPTFAGNSLKIEVRIYSADWCIPCKEMHKALEDEGVEHLISVEIEGENHSIPIEYRDVTDEDNKQATQGKVSDSLPEIQLLVNGERAGVHNGAILSIDMFKDFIQKAYASYKEFNQSPSLDEIEPELNLKLKTLTPSTALLVGTGKNASENPVFIGMSLRNISEVLRDKYAFSEDRYVIFYGAGDKSNKTPDAQVVAQDHSKSTIAVENVNADLSFSRKNLRQAFSAIKKAQTKNTLMVFSGHGHPGGVNLWQDFNDLSPKELKEISSASKTNLVIVSGNCHGGQFAFTGSCGFFAARPDTPAEGCSPSFTQLDSNHLPTDYSNVFFRGLKEGSADFDHNGEITFEESHWYATIFGGKTDVTYTTLDAFAEDYFKKHPESLPELIEKNEALELVKKIGTPGEQKAIAALINPNTQFQLSFFEMADIPFGKIYLKDVEIPFVWKTSSGIALTGVYKIHVFGEQGSRIIFKAKLDQPSLEQLASFVSLKFGKEVSKINQLIINESALQVFYELKQKNLKTGQAMSGYSTISISDLKIELPKEIYSYNKRYLYEGMVNYRPALVQLIRRLLFKSLKLDLKTQLEFNAIRDCENQSVAKFLIQ